jgi:hypothetical protein
MRLGSAAATALALALAGCSADYVEDNQAPVLLLIKAINGGAQLDSDVRNGEFSTFVCEDEVEVEVTSQKKNPNGPTAASSDVQLGSYTVRYTRSDGRGTEGVDVPYRVTGNLATTVAVGGTTTFPLEVVRRQAKVEPPLSSIYQAALLTVTAEVTLYGKTISGASVSATGRFQIDFADFGDKDTSCPAN